MSKIPSLVLAASVITSTAQAQVFSNWLSANGTPWRSAVSGECIRSGFWTPETAHPDCGRVEKATSQPKESPAIKAAALAPADDHSDYTRAVPGLVGSALAPSYEEKPPMVQVKSTPALPPSPQKSTVLFGFDQAVLTPQAQALLDQQLATLQATELMVVVAVGHTDSVGAEKYNLSLSTRRAAAVRDYLLSRGVSVQRVYIEGRGESDPLVNNSTESGRAKNRRVEIELIPAKQS